MAETRLSTKRRLSINLSFLNLTKQTSHNNNTQKSPKTFHHDPNGVVGLQILAALNHSQDHHDNRRHRQDSIFTNGISISPSSSSSSSNPIPIHHHKPFDNKLISMEEMELCEEYTCVISHVGDNLIKKREYFEADLLFGNDVHERVFVVSDNSSVNNCGVAGGDPRGFLNTCFLCDKVLDGLDIFMYRGEKAFCSVECRHEQISIDECKDKRHRSSSGMRKQLDCSVSPCSSSPMQFFAGVAAA